MTARVSMEVCNLLQGYTPVTKYHGHPKTTYFCGILRFQALPTGTQPETIRVFHPTFFGTVKPRHLTFGSMEFMETLRLGKELDASVTSETPDVPKGRRSEPPLHNSDFFLHQDFKQSNMRL